MHLVATFAGSGLVLGLLVGRWWEPPRSVSGSLWKEVEIPGWLYGLFAGGIAALGIAVGVFLRRRLA